MFDPSGSLTGGYTNPNDSILLKNEEFKRLNAQIEELRKEQKHLENDIAVSKKVIIERNMYIIKFLYRILIICPR